MATDLFEQRITKDVWYDKYRCGNERSPLETLTRTVIGIFDGDNNKKAQEDTLDVVTRGFLLFGGRITYSAGTERSSTWMNCFVNGTVEDSIPGIYRALQNSATTLSQSGGIGTDFSPLRPKGAPVVGVGGKAAGIVAFMESWDAAARALQDAGSRRSAMMATISDTHPDVVDFINAKHEKGKLTQCNMSVLVSDALMEAVRDNEEWELYFHLPPKNSGFIRTFDDDDGIKQYIWKVIPARKLWNLIMRSTYEYSEPGVIFIDRVNDLNNLQYIENIRCTNPCGEQPLPPNGCCLLAHINLSRMVNSPFTSDAHIDREALKHTSRVAVRALDNVIDRTKYPLLGQEQEELEKRRIGLGVTGLADMLAQLNHRYGSSDAEALTRSVMRTVAVEAYRASVALAVERECCPAVSGKDNRESFLGSPFVQKMPDDIQEGIRTHGIRNGVLLSIAPVGTGAIFYGNHAAGIEPVFDHVHTRHVRQDDGSTKPYIVRSYSSLLYCRTRELNWRDPSIELPDFMVTAQDISISDHIRIQAAAQAWVDASVSKTINCPEETTFEQFERAYMQAYDMGCKGCTTYRPCDTVRAIRGSILETGDKKAEPQRKLRPRPRSLRGETYKLKWPKLPTAMYVTINNDANGQPFEIFINCASAKYTEWTTALTRALSSIMRMTDDPMFIAKELQQIVSAHDFAFVEGKRYDSLLAMIGHTLEKHIEASTPGETRTITIQVGERVVSTGQAVEVMSHKADTDISATVDNLLEAWAEICPICGKLSLVKSEGCETCSSCGYSSC